MDPVRDIIIQMFTSCFILMDQLIIWGASYLDYVLGFLITGTILSVLIANYRRGGRSD